MATVALTTAGKCTALFPDRPPTVIRNKIAAEALTAGNAVYYTTAGKAGIADATSAGKEQFRGIALRSVGAGEPCSILEEGECSGFAVSAINCDALLYLDTAGAIADAANGTKTVAVARVEALADTPTNTRYIRVFTRPSANW